MAFIAYGMYTLVGLKTSSTYMNILPGFIILGIGLGIMVPAITRASLDPVGPEQAGIASGIFKAGSMLGGTLGVAVSMSIFVHFGTHKLKELIGPDAVFVALGGSPAQNKAFEYGYTYAMGLAMLLAILGIIIAIVLIRGVGVRKATTGSH